MLARVKRCFFGDTNRAVDDAILVIDNSIRELTALDTTYKADIREAENAIAQTNDETARERLRHTIELLRRECQVIERAIPILNEEKYAIRRFKTAKHFFSGVATVHNVRQRYNCKNF